MILSLSLLLAAEGAAEPSGIDLLLPRDVNEIIVGVLAFVIVFGFIWRVAAPALNEYARESAKGDQGTPRGRRGREV